METNLDGKLKQNFKGHRKSMKTDLKFILEGNYKGLSIGDSIEKMKEHINELFHNESCDDLQIYTDNELTELTFVNDQLDLIVLKSFKKGFLSRKFKKTITKLDKKGIAWNFTSEWTMLKQVNIRILSSSVNLLFELENDELVLVKVFIS